MKILKRKIVNAGILLLVLIIVLSTQTYAKPFTESFRGGLIQINDFFEKEQYKPYSNAIDFFFFALLFISIYLMGVRYAFKEVKRPETVIAILLGLMTAFLLVLGGFSATILLPYISWLFYILLFILYWWLLKGIKSKFWRFIMALLLTLLTIGLVQGVFGALTAPDAEGFFKSFGKSLGTIQFPEIGVPGVPPDLAGLFGITTAPTGPATLPTTPTPAVPTERVPPKPEEKPFTILGLPWWAWVLILALLAIGLSQRRRIADLLRRRRLTPQAPTAPTIIEEIDDFIKKKRELMREIIQINQIKDRIIKDATKKIAILAKLNREDPANLFTDAARATIESEGGAFKEFYDTEIFLTVKLKELKDVEVNIYNKLEQWKTKFSSQGDISQEVDFLKNWIESKTTIRQLREMGIIWLIVICYDFEKREITLSKALRDLLQSEDTRKLEELVKGKFSTVKADEKKLMTYHGTETWIIKLLTQKIEEQIRKLEELKRKIRGAVPSPYGAPYGAPPYGAPYAPSSAPLGAPYGTSPYGAPPYGVPAYGAPRVAPGSPYTLQRAGRMRVLMVSFAHPSASNGISTVLGHLMPALTLLDVNVELLTKWYGEPFFYYPSVSSTAQQFNTIDEFLATKNNNYYSFIHAHAVTFAEQINPPDPTTYWDKLLNYFKVPSAYTVHFLNRYHLLISKWTKSAATGRKWIGDVLEPYILDRVNVIIQLNRSFVQVTDEIYPGKNYSKKTVIIPNGVDLSVVTIKSKPKSGEINLLYLGRLDRSKGMYEICVAFGELYKKYPNLKLHIVGEGATRGKYKDFEADTMKRLLRMAKVPTDRFIFYGAKYGKEKEGILNNSDFVIMPSFAEYFSMVALEAISHKKPLIASSALGLKETFIDTGLAYPIGFGELKYTDSADSQKHYKLRVKKIVEAVSYCIEHRDECEQRAEMAYRFLHANANIFDWMSIAEKTKEVYESLINTNTVPRIEVTIPRMAPSVAAPSPPVPAPAPVTPARLTPQYLYLKPLNATPEKPILIISEYHKDSKHYFLIGIEKDSEILLKDSNVKDANQAVIGFDEHENAFMISKSPHSRIAINGIEQITTKLSDGLKLDINNYAFVVYIEQKERAELLQRAEYEQQFPAILNLTKRIVSPTPTPEIHILSPSSSNRQFNLGDTITLEAEIRNLAIPPEGFEYQWIAAREDNLHEVKLLAYGTKNTNILSDTVEPVYKGCRIGEYYVYVRLPGKNLRSEIILVNFT